MSEVPMSDFDHGVRKYYQATRLSEEGVRTILASSVGRGRRRRVRHLRLTGAAAVLVIGLFGLSRHIEDRAVAEGILAEVSMNHRKRLAVEVASDQFQVVQDGLDRLDFPIHPATQGASGDYLLLGGRYCSIRGELAAQLKVRDPASEAVLTLYVTPLTEVLARLTPLESEREGVWIRLWDEDGRFFALAGER